MTFADCAASAARAERRLRRARREERAVTLSRREAFKGAEVNRLLADWVAALMHPDDEMRWSLARLRARGRELARNNAFAKGFLTQVSTNVIGPAGIKLQAQVKDNSGKLNKRINDRIESGWSEWGEDPTTGGRGDFVHLQQQTIKTVAREGEAFLRIWRGFNNPFGFALEPVDPDQIDERFNRARIPGRQTEIRLGVEVNDFGRPIAYWLWDRPEYFTGAIHEPRQRVRVPADQIIHLYDPERANQTRGLLWFGSVMVPLKMLVGYTESELVASRTGAAKMGWFQKKDGGGVAEPPADEETNVIEMEANPGSLGFVPDGYEFREWNPQHPSTAFPAFVKAMLREVATGLGVSYNALANDLEGVNFSSMRSGLLIERDVWRCMQRWWIAQLLRRVYREWLNMALLTGAVVLDSRDFRKFAAVKWTPRGWAWVDPQKEATAGQTAIKMGLSSRHKLLAEQGLDFEEVLEDLALENELARDAGVDISGDAPSGGGKPPDEEEDEEEEDEERNFRKEALASAILRNGGHRG